jgi:hypothetical protein
VNVPINMETLSTIGQPAATPSALDLTWHGCRYGSLESNATNKLQRLGQRPNVNLRGDFTRCNVKYERIRTVRPADDSAKHTPTK